MRSRNDHDRALSGRVAEFQAKNVPASTRVRQYLPRHVWPLGESAEQIAVGVGRRMRQENFIVLVRKNDIEGDSQSAPLFVGWIVCNILTFACPAQANLL